MSTWEPLPPVRRVVTAINDRRRSFIAEDGPSPASMTVPERPGYRNSNLWRTEGGPTDLTQSDTVLQQSGVLPPSGGTVLRVIDFPPQAATLEEQQRQSAAVFAAIYPDAKHQPAHGRHAGMHITDTVDYAIVLQGEIVAIMEDDQTVLRAGDVLIQRGTNHAWANQSTQIARVAFVLVDATGSRPSAR